MPHTVRSLSLILLAALALGACATYSPARNASTVATAEPGVVVGNATLTVPAGAQITGPSALQTTYQPGFGVIESIALVRYNPPAGTASTGGSRPPQLIAYRLTARMDDGSLQAVDQENRNFKVGDRIEFASDGRIVRR